MLAVLIIVILILCVLGAKRVRFFRWVDDWFGDSPGFPPKTIRIENSLGSRLPPQVRPTPVLEDTAVYPSEAPTEDLSQDWPQRPQSERSA